MGLEAIENQPIQFDVVQSACSVEGINYIQIVDNTDVSQIQFNITPCLTAPNVVVNGGFASADNWTVTDSFAVDTSINMACKAIGGIGTISQSNIFIIGKFYQLRILVNTISETMQVWNGTTQLGNVSGVGEYVFSFLAVGDNVSIRSFSATNEACITSISAYELDSRLILAIFNESGVYQTQIRLDITPEYFRFAKNTVTVNINWDDLGVADGCYYIGIADPCINTNGQNGLPDPNMTNLGLWDFSVLGNWDAPSTPYAIDSGVGGIGSGTTTDLNTMQWLHEDITLLNGQSYNYTITIFSNSIQTETEILLGGVSSGALLVAVGGITETFTGTIVCGGTQDIELTIVSGNDAAVYSYAVLHFDISLTTGSDMVPDSESVNVKLGTFDCSVLVNANCNEDALGFEFDTSLFNPRIRLEGELINPSYPTVRTAIENTRGTMNVVYGKRNKARLLKIGLQPSYVLDFLSLIPIFDNFWIDAIAYFSIEEQIDIEYPDEIVNTGKVTLNVMEQSGALTNRNTTGNVNDTHVLISNFIVHPTVRDSIITEPNTNDAVIAL